MWYADLDGEVDNVGAEEGMVRGPFQDLYLHLYQYSGLWLHPFFIQVCASRITLQKISRSLISTTRSQLLSAQDDFAWSSSSQFPNPKLLPLNCPQLSPHSRCITVRALKFPKLVALHLCMPRSVSVLTGLSRLVLSSYLYVFGIEAFLYLSNLHSWIW